MVGDSSVNITYFIKRLICANGLIMETLKTNKRVFHSGNSNTFADRLNYTVSGAYEGMNSITEMIRTLAEIEFDPDKLVDNGGAEFVYKIIPLSEKENEARKNSEKKPEFDKKMIADYPYIYAGEFSSRIFESLFRDNATMFDFINVFTEYAHNKEIKTERRIQIEKRTGDMAKWIIDNKEKLV
jgi:hypothetical protein